MRQVGKSFIQSITITEWVLMALLAASNSVLSSLISPLNKLLTAWGGPILTSTTTGLYMVYGLLAMYIIRKPGAALFTYAIGALLQIMIGVAYGAWSAIAAAACYAVIVEPIFYLYRYKRFGWVTMLLVGTIMVPLWFVVAAFMFGYTKYAAVILLITLAVRCLSGMLLCGALTKWLGDQLAGTRYVRPFAIGRDSRSKQA
ncbi:ECF transporter S component [Paenibacillus sp. ACRRX]|uniref:ECF transporter S component n=1 Tax=unclassified Paenibacillus TaxID=185978 RepID=UPI001EF45E64|nr:MULTISPECIES: ECF transporter S component [unclassified Paenibacillus]MCG7408565.1 ECF transporter S component [Paenibacillus sp. ACRRX]MDK8182813.1 ECF transporter S component [Paenibacillus sp. UMB4589-SE434]